MSLNIGYLKGGIKFYFQLFSILESENKFPYKWPEGLTKMKTEILYWGFETNSRHIGKKQLSCPRHIFPLSLKGWNKPHILHARDKLFVPNTCVISHFYQSVKWVREDNNGISGWNRIRLTLKIIEHSIYPQKTENPRRFQSNWMQMLGNFSRVQSQLHCSAQDWPGGPSKRATNPARAWFT